MRLFAAEDQIAASKLFRLSQMSQRHWRYLEALMSLTF